MSPEQSTIVIVDEQPLVSKALASRLQAHGFSIVASFRSGSETVAFLRETAVDVVLLGLSLRAEGLACLREIRAVAPDTRVVVCNEPGEEGTPETAFAEGAAAYVEKSGHPDDIVAAVKQATARSIFLAPSARNVPAGGSTAVLTPRELDVLALVADGNTNAAIARQLGVSEQAVKFHLSNIFRKLGVSNRTELSLHAQLRGILPPDRKGRDTSRAS